MVRQSVVAFCFTGLLACSGSDELPGDAGSDTPLPDAAGEVVEADTGDGDTLDDGSADAPATDADAGPDTDDGSADTPDVPDATVDTGADDADSGDAPVDTSDADTEPATGWPEWPTPPRLSLTGPGGARAIDALPTTFPADLAPDDIDEGSNRWVRNRLFAAIAPTATVADVNAALSTHNLAIVTALGGHPMVTLSSEPFASPDAARAFAGALVEEPAFVWADAVYLSGPPDWVEDDDKLLPPDGGHELNDNLDGARWPEAWNVASLARATGFRVLVAVVDDFAAVAPDPLVSALTFAPGSAPMLRRDGSPDPRGNHGHWVTGILAANFDETPPVGTSPSPVELLDVRALTAPRLDPLAELLRAIAFVPPGEPAVVNQSRGFNDPFEEDVSRFARLLMASVVRLAMIQAGPDQALWINASGNNGFAFPTPDVRTEWPTIAEARVADLPELLEGEERRSFEVIWNDLVRTEPEMVNPQTPLLVVGASTYSGSVHPNETPGGDVRALGVEVVGVCAVEEPGPCNMTTRVRRASGTSAAAPQIAGLAAYLWNLDPSLTVNDVREIILAAAGENGVVDAFNAVLAVETYNAAPVRTALVDLNGDGRFGFDDLSSLYGAIELREASRPGLIEDNPRHERADINGDRYVRSDVTLPFDIDADGSLGAVRYSVPGRAASVTINEERVSDLALLCALAYSDRYSGDPGQRDARVGERCANPESEPIVPRARLVGRGIELRTNAITDYRAAAGGVADRAVLYTETVENRFSTEDAVEDVHTTFLRRISQTGEYTIPTDSGSLSSAAEALRDEFTFDGDGNVLSGRLHGTVDCSLRYENSSLPTCNGEASAACDLAFAQAIFSGGFSLRLWESHRLQLTGTIRTQGRSVLGDLQDTYGRVIRSIAGVRTTDERRGGSGGETVDTPVTVDEVIPPGDHWVDIFLSAACSTSATGAPSPQALSGSVDIRFTLTPDPG